jgi:hypothetical protein
MNEETTQEEEETTFPGPERVPYYDRMRPYWDAPTSQDGLKAFMLSKTTAETKVCASCEEEFPIEEFWTGYVLSGFCERDRKKARARRKKVEQQIDKKNEETSGGVLTGGGGLFAKIKNKIASFGKGAAAKPVGAAAGKAVGSAAGGVLGDDAGKAVGKVASKMVQKAMTS